MTKKEREIIINYSKTLTDEEIENKYYECLDKSLGSLCDDMYEIGYDISDIMEREKYEKHLKQTASLLGYLCEERGIKLFNEF